MNQDRSAIRAVENMAVGHDGIGLLSANWGWILLRGIIALLLGFVCFFFPLGALLGFTMLFAAWSAVDGVLSLIAGIRGAKVRYPRWGAFVLRGALGMIVAVLIAALPMAAMVGYAYVTLAIIAAGAILMGLLEIAAAIRLRRAIKGEWLLALSGILSLFLGAVLVWLMLSDPLASLLSAAWAIGAYASIAGIALILLALRLRTAP